jgi:hypothetical protein
VLPFWNTRQGGDQQRQNTSKKNCSHQGKRISTYFKKYVEILLFLELLISEICKKGIAENL